MEYKGLVLDDDVGPFIRYMPQVDDFRETLAQLQAVWDSLALLGQLSGVGSEMGDTREAFFALSQNLINHLGKEHLQGVQDSLRLKAAVSVEMLLRNLFERTADIGFLATDHTIAAFMAEYPSLLSQYGRASRERQDQLLVNIRAHCQAYVDKYSVYNNLMLLSVDGDVLFQLHDTGVKKTRDCLVNEAINSPQAYIEIFRPTDLLPDNAQPLIYACPVMDENDRALGVLCLCFNFEDECQRIFTELDDGDWALLSLTDVHGRVIASSDPIQLPIGTKVVKNLTKTIGLQRLGGRRYVSMTRSGKGYQGYEGQGWMGHAMIPLDNAFEPKSYAQLSMQNLQGLDIFSQDLVQIPLRADVIQSDLNRSVWNGRLKQARHADNSVFGSALLWEVSQTGLKTKTIFANAIRNLYQTVIGARLMNNRFLAALAVNIMDRNLYERANDCRWWALTDVFRQVLAQSMPSDADKQRLSSILSYINRLYTVYTGIVLYDAQGRVLAVSTPELMPHVGQRLHEPWVAKSLSLTDSQSFVMSDFVPTPLYQGQPTYIYAAAVMHPDRAQQVVGGIGVIFDSHPQLAAILTDAQPSQPDVFSVFIDDEQRIISTTHPELSVGNRMPINLQPTMSAGSGVMDMGGQRYAVGMAKATGYREYHGQGRLIYAAMLSRIGVAMTGNDAKTVTSLSIQKPEAGLSTLEVATFVIGRQYFALPAVTVVMAEDCQRLSTGAAIGQSLLCGYLSWDKRAIPVIDLAKFLALEDSHPQQIVVIEHGGWCFGLLVDQLDQVAHVALDQCLAPPFSMGQQLVEALIQLPLPSQPLLMLLSVTRLVEWLFQSESATASSAMFQTMLQQLSADAEQALLLDV